MYKILWFVTDTFDQHLTDLVLFQLEINDFISLLQVNKQYYEYYANNNLWIHYFGYPRLESIEHDYQLKHYIPIELIKLYGPSYKDFMKKIPFMKLNEKYNRDYIDNLSPKIMTNAIIWGVDHFKRYYVALRIYNPNYEKHQIKFAIENNIPDIINSTTLGQQVITMFQRYTGNYGFWRFGMCYNCDEYFSGDSVNLNGDDKYCIIPFLKQLQNGTHPTLKLV